MATIDPMQNAATEASDPRPEPQWQNLKGVFGCVLAALTDAAPVFIESLFNCLNGSGPPTDAEYQPGDRRRCP